MKSLSFASVGVLLVMAFFALVPFISHAAAPACVSIAHTLSLGSKDADTGGEVTKLQQFLAAQGSTIYPEASVTGFFGTKTMLAVTRFQVAHGVIASADAAGAGYVGAKTRAALGKGCGGTATITQIPVKTFVTIDQSSLTATSTHARITGTANVTPVTLLLQDAKGEGIYLTKTIPVKNGHWSNAIPLSLAEGKYTITYTGDGALHTATLSVSY